MPTPVQPRRLNRHPGPVQEYTNPALAPASTLKATSKRTARRPGQTLACG